jgi:serine/threonine-protein kinase
MALTRFGHYEVIAEIGRGGMATVYLARDDRFDREVALKVLPQQFTHDRTFLWRFEQEAQLLAALEHYAIVPLYDFGEEQGYPYIVMRFMPGGALSSRIASRQLQLKDVVDITRRVGDALDEAHGRDIVHRDLKPGNILFDQNDKAYLADFGIARLAEATVSFTGSSIIGTPAYMSPEQVHGSRSIDGRSDLYAMGIIIFEMLSGQVPYVAETPTKQLMAHVLEPVPDILQLNPDLAPELAAVVTRALAKEPDERFQTGAELGAAMAAAVRGETAQQRVLATAPVKRPTPAGTMQTTSDGQQGKTKIRSRWLLMAGCAALLLVLLAAGIIGVTVVGSLIDGTATQAVVAQVDEDEAATKTPLPTRTASRTATRTATPSRTPTRTPASTPSATSKSGAVTLQPTAVLQVVISSSSINFRTGPGTAYRTVSEKPFLSSGEVLVVLARTENGRWLNVETEEGVRGWVAASVVELLHPETIEEIPVAATIPVAPTPTRTPTSTPPPRPTNTPVPPTPTNTRLPTPTPTNTPLPPVTPTPTNSPVPPPTPTPTVT